MGLREKNLKSGCRASHVHSFEATQFSRFGAILNFEGVYLIYISLKLHLIVSDFSSISNLAAALLLMQPIFNIRLLTLSIQSPQKAKQEILLSRNTISSHLKKIKN